MTSAGPRSGRKRKMVPPPPEIYEYHPELDAYSSWLLAIEWKHHRMVAELVADYDNRLPEGWLEDFIQKA